MKGSLARLTKVGGPARFAAVAAAALVAACSQPAPATHGWMVVAHLKAGKTAGPVRLGGPWAFVPNMGEGTVSQIDRASGRLVATIQVTDPKTLRAQGCAPDSVHAYHSASWGWRACNTPYTVAWDGSSLWALDNGRMQLVRVDPVRRRVTDRIDMPGTGWDMAISGDTAWVSGNDADSSLYQVSLRTLHVVATISNLDQGTGALAAGPDGTWVICARGDTGNLDHIDPSSGKVMSRYPIEWWSQAVVTDRGAIYVRGSNGGDISRLNPATGAVEWTQPGPGFVGNFGLDQLGIAPDGIWLSGPKTERINPTTGRLEETIRVASTSAAAGDNELWLVQLDGSVLGLKKR